MQNVKTMSITHQFANANRQTIKYTIPSGIHVGTNVAEIKQNGPISTRALSGQLKGGINLQAVPRFQQVKKNKHAAAAAAES